MCKAAIATLWAHQRNDPKWMNGTHNSPLSTHPWIWGSNSIAEPFSKRVASSLRLLNALNSEDRGLKVLFPIISVSMVNPLFCTWTWLKHFQVNPIHSGGVRVSSTCFTVLLAPTTLFMWVNVRPLDERGVWVVRGGPIFKDLPLGLRFSSENEF